MPKALAVFPLPPIFGFPLITQLIASADIVTDIPPSLCEFPSEFRAHVDKPPSLGELFEGQRVPFFLAS